MQWAYSFWNANAMNLTEVKKWSYSVRCTSLYVSRIFQDFAFALEAATIDCSWMLLLTPWSIGWSGWSIGWSPLRSWHVTHNEDPRIQRFVTQSNATNSGEASSSQQLLKLQEMAKSISRQVWFSDSNSIHSSYTYSSYFSFYIHSIHILLFTPFYTVSFILNCNDANISGANEFMDPKKVTYMLMCRGLNLQVKILGKNITSKMVQVSRNSWAVPKIAASIFSRHCISGQPRWTCDKLKSKV